MLTECPRDDCTETERHYHNLYVVRHPAIRCISAEPHCADRHAHQAAWFAPCYLPRPTELHPLPKKDRTMDYRDLIEGALDNIRGAWPTDDADNRIPCGACEHGPEMEAHCGAQPVHTWHGGAGAFEALIEPEDAGRAVHYWLGTLHVGTAGSGHPSGLIHVAAFNEPAVPVTREADIMPTLLTLWGYEENETA